MSQQNRGAIIWQKIHGAFTSRGLRPERKNNSNNSKIFSVSLQYERVVAKKETKMNSEKVLMGKRKKIALVAHENKKEDLLKWVKFNKYARTTRTI
jgi:hypothetical protein